MEEVYYKLKAEYEESEERAAAVRKRIADVEQVAGDMFKEWETEIRQISDPGLREKSRKALQTSSQNDGPPRKGHGQGRVEKDVERLIAGMERSIGEANLFLKNREA